MQKFIKKLAFMEKYKKYKKIYSYYHISANYAQSVINIIGIESALIWGHLKKNGRAIFKVTDV